MCSHGVSRSRCRNHHRHLLGDHHYLRATAMAMGRVVVMVMGWVVVVVSDVMGHISSVTSMLGLMVHSRRLGLRNFMN